MRAEAELSLENAITVARSQHARLFELRAATALTRLPRDPEERGRRAALLASIYGAFAEGFGTLDLKEARTLLEEVSA